MNIAIDQLKRFIEPLKRRLILMIARAVVQEVKDDDGIQFMKLGLMAGEVREGVERFQNYGFTSNPPDGSEAVVAFVNGNRDHGLIICVDNREYRLKPLAKGEVAFYTDEGDYIHFKRNRILEISTKELIVNATESATVNTKNANINASMKTTVTTPLAEFSANVKVKGNLDVDGTSQLTGLVTAPAGVTALGGLSSGGSPTSGQITDQVGHMSNLRTIYNSHTHPENGDGGGTTSAPNQQMPTS